MTKKVVRINSQVHKSFVEIQICSARKLKFEELEESSDGTFLHSFGAIWKLRSKFKKTHEADQAVVLKGFFILTRFKASN